MGPGWMGFWGHPWFLSQASCSTHPALPGMGYSCVWRRRTALVPAQVSWPGARGDMKSSSLTSELSLCKLRTNIDRGWANAARISPAGACFAALPPTITHATLTKALVCGYSCVYTASACVALPKRGRRKGGVIFLAVFLRDLSALNPVLPQQSEALGKL